MYLVQERQPQLQSLAAFGDQLEEGMVCGVRVEKDDLWMEGPYWLIKLLGRAFAAPSELVHAGSVFEEGCKLSSLSNLLPCPLTL